MAEWVDEDGHYLSVIGLGYEPGFTFGGKIPVTQPIRAYCPKCGVTRVAFQVVE